VFAAAVGKTLEVTTENSTSDTGPEFGDEHEHVDDLAWPVPVATMIPLAAVFCGLLLWAFGVDWLQVALFPFGVLLGVITVIDLRELRIPNFLTRPATVLALPLLAVAQLSEWPDLSLWRAGLGGAAMFVFYLLLIFIYPAGMGWGDVKLAPVIGAQLGFLGWIPTVRGLVLAYLVIGPVAIALLLFGRAKMKTGLPFGPFMAVGAVIALVLEARGF